LNSHQAAARIKAAARSLGFDLAACTSAEIPERDKNFFLGWCGKGMAGDMGWLCRNPEKRADPKTLLPEAAGLITLGVSYFQGPVPEKPSFPAGRVARYAWGLDYHEVIAGRLEQFKEELKNIFGSSLRIKTALDAQPLLEKPFWKTGLATSSCKSSVIRNLPIDDLRSISIELSLTVFLPSPFGRGLG